MTWNISTIVAEVFYCIIGLIFIATGMKALKDESCAHRTTTALFWFILAFTFIAGPYLPKWITGLCVVFLAILTAFKRVAPSKSDMPKEAETRAAAVMGYAVSIIIALVGVLNFINSMVTAIITRKREFAMIQSIGMTKRQLRKMLMFEGLYYAGMTLLASYVLGSLTVGVIVRALVAGGYSTFHFTLLPLVICTPILIVFAIVIPYICFKNLEKQSIVERLRATD